MVNEDQRFIISYFYITTLLFIIFVILQFQFQNNKIITFLTYLAAIAWIGIFPVLIFRDIIVDVVSIFPFFKRSLKIKSGQLIFLTNLLVIFIAIYKSWSLSDIIWLYWIESLIVGLFMILTLKKIEKNDDSEENYGSSRIISEIILIQILFLFSIILFFQIPPIQKIILYIVIYLIIHGFSFYYNYNNDMKVIKKSLIIDNEETSRIRSKKLVKASPRIWTMWILSAILIGLISIESYIPQEWNYSINTVSSFISIEILLLLIFLVIKTIADGAAHKAYHEGKNLFSKKRNIKSERKNKIVKLKSLKLF